MSGFDCQFENKIEDYFQTKCRVCNLILREPHQVSCCGESFCKACIEHAKENYDPCPGKECNEVEYSYFENKGLKKNLYKFGVFCSNTEKGCEWKGPLGLLDGHLNLKPDDDSQLEGCMFSEIMCFYCDHFFQRKEVDHHQTQVCCKRPYTCDYCKDFRSTFEEAVGVGENGHLSVCDFFPVDCPNACGEKVERSEVQDHVNSHCHLTVVDCEFQYAGCEVKLARNELENHHSTMKSHHIQLVSVHCKEALKQKEDENKKLRDKLQQLQILNNGLSEEVTVLRKQSNHTILKNKSQ